METNISTTDPYILEQERLQAQNAVSQSLMQEYADNLLAIPEAVDYIMKRGLTIEHAEKGEIGYCPPYFKSRSLLLRGRIVIPIKDVHGSIVALAGRIFEPARELALRAIWDAKSADPKKAQHSITMWQRAKWWNEPYPKRNHLYNLNLAKDSAQDLGYVVLVEGYFDSLVLTQSGIKNSAALCGSSLTPIHATKIKRYADHVIVMLDGDKAGESGVERMMPILEEAQITPHVFVLPEGCDPDEFVPKISRKQLIKILRHMVDTGVEVMNASI